MDDSCSSFQAQCAFTTAGNLQPTIRRVARCSVVRSATGTHLVSTTEDIFDGSCEYALAGSLDALSVGVVLSIKKQSNFIWAISTSQVVGGASLANEPELWTGSGSLSEQAGAAAGFVPDGDNKVELIAAAIRYPLPGASTSVQLSVHVNTNTLLNTGGGGVTTFEIFKNGAGTGDTIPVGPSVTGSFTQTFVLAFAAGDQFDLHASTPGDDGNHAITFGASLNFTSVIPPAQLAVVDTAGCQINLTLRRVDPS